MGNGTKKHGPALEDHIREEGLRHQRALQRAIDDERRNHGVELEPYRETADSFSEVTIGKEGVRAKGFRPWLMALLLVLLTALVAFWMWLKWH